MLDATEDYIAGGGHYIYLGANGYYCSVAHRRDEPWVLECRKFGMGWKAWRHAGEHYMATNGQRGASWRAQGRPPNKISGLVLSLKVSIPRCLSAGCRQLRAVIILGHGRNESMSLVILASRMTVRPVLSSTPMT